MNRITFLVLGNSDTDTVIGLPEGAQTLWLPKVAPGPGGRPMRVMYAGMEYTDPKFPCLYASETPTALQADNQSWFMLDVTPFYSVKFLIACNSDVARTCQIAAVMKKGSAAGSYPSPVSAAP